MRFPAITFISAVGLLLILGVTYLALFSFNESDRQEYWKLLKQANPDKSESSLSPYTAKQQHQGVCKEIWFLQKGQRLKLCIYSAHSELALHHHENKTDVVEKMKNVSCYMQEELYYLLPDGREIVKQLDGKFLMRNKDPADPNSYVANDTHLKPMQVIRYLKAKTASYFYSEDRFIAQDVEVYRFAVPGHDLVESLKGIKPLMSGTAKSVEFSMGKEMHFMAHQLKAILNDKKDDR